MCCLLVLTTHSSPFPHFPWTSQIHFRETCLFDRTWWFWNPLLAKRFLLSVLMLLLQLSSLRDASHASGVFYPEVLNFVHNKLVTDTSLWTDLVLGIFYLCHAVHSCPSNPESILPHGSTKMYSLFWDYTSAKSLWLVKHGMLLAPNLLLVTPGGSFPNLWESIAATTYWNLSGVLERCRVFLILSHFGYILITGKDPPLPSPSRNLSSSVECEVQPCPPFPCRDYLYESPSRLDFPIFFFAKFLRLLG